MIPLPAQSLPVGQKAFRFWPWGVLALILVANAAFLSFNCFRIFKFFDMGNFLDASWRVYNGQKPYIDFIYQVGPIHLYLNVLFFKIFGFGKTAIWVHVAVVHSCVITASYLLMEKYVSRTLALLIALLTTACYYWWLSHPWYMQTAHLWSFLGVVLLVRHLPFQDSRHAFWTAFACGIAATASYFTKPNVGAGHGLMFLMAFAVSRRRFSALTGFAAGAASMTGVMLLTIGDVGAFIDQTILTFGKTHGGRLGRLKETGAWFLNYYWIIVLTVSANLLVRPKALLELVAVFFGLYITMIMETVTSGAMYRCNIPLMGLFLGTAILLVRCPTLNPSETVPDRFGRISLVLITVMALTLTGMSAHYGFQVKGWTLPDRWVIQYPINPVGTYPLKSKPFTGWLTEKQQGMEVDALTTYIQANVPKTDSLMVLTDLTILYSLTGRESPRGIPFGWTINVSPAPGKQLEDFRRKFRANPPRWIVTHYRQVAFLNPLLSYLDLWDDIRKEYVLVFKTDRYMLLKKR